MTKTAVLRFDPKTQTEAQFEEAILREAQYRARDGRDPELSAPERLETRLRVLTDEIAVAAHEDNAEALAQLESERTAVRLELDRLLAAERGRAISEHRKRIAAETEAKAAAQQKAAEARVLLLQAEEIARGHLRAWAKGVEDLVRLGWDAGEPYVHKRIVGDLREVLFRNINDPVIARRVFAALDTWPTASERS